MRFDMVNMTSPKERLEGLENAEKIDIDYIPNAIKNGVRILHYADSMISDDDDFYYEDYVDNEFNFYTIFVNLKDKSFKGGYKYNNENMEWTARVDNQYYGNPLGVDYEQELKNTDLSLAKRLYPNENIETGLLKLQELYKEMEKAIIENLNKKFSNFVDINDIKFGDKIETYEIL